MVGKITKDLKKELREKLGKDTKKMITADLATFALKHQITSAMSRRKSPEQVPGGEDAKIDDEEPTNEEIKMDDSPN